MGRRGGCGRRGGGRGLVLGGGRFGGGIFDFAFGGRFSGVLLRLGVMGLRLGSSLWWYVWLDELVC